MSVDELRDMLCCIAKIERSTARLYSALAEAEEDQERSAILQFISADSEKHARIFRGLAGGRKPPSHARCVELLGEMYSRACETLRGLREKLRGGARALDVLRELISYEDAVGEEYFTRMYSGILSVHPSPGKARRLLKLIAEDEERHAKLLEEAGRR